MKKELKKIITIFFGILLIISSTIVSKNNWNVKTRIVEAADIYTPLYYTMAKDATVTTNSLSLNKRSQPSTSGKVIGRLSKGQHVVVVGISKDRQWYYLDDNSYASAQYISFESDIIISGVKKICSVINQSYVLDVAFAKKETLTNVMINQDNGGANQHFNISYVGNGYYTIQDTNSGLYLDCYTGRKNENCNIVIHDYLGSDAQLFKILNLGAGEYLIQPKCTDYFLNVNGGQAYDGANVWTYQLDGTAACYWNIVDANASPISSEESKISQKLQQMMNGEIYNGSYKVNTKYTGEYSKEQCKGFAKSVYNKLFGYLIGSTCTKPRNYKINISSESIILGSTTNMTQSNICSIFDKARAGDFIQVRRSHSGSHSMIYLSSDSNSVTVYECNTDNKNGIKKNTYTYQNFCDRNVGVSVYTAKDYYLH